MEISVRTKNARAAIQNFADLKGIVKKKKNEKKTIRNVEEKLAKVRQKSEHYIDDIGNLEENIKILQSKIEGQKTMLCSA